MLPLTPDPICCPHVNAAHLRVCYSRGSVIVNVETVDVVVHCVPEGLPYVSHRFDLLISVLCRVHVKHSLAATCSVLMRMSSEYSENSFRPFKLWIHGALISSTARQGRRAFS